MSDKEASLSHPTKGLLQKIRLVKENGRSHHVKSNEEFTKLLKEIISEAADDAQSSRLEGSALINSLDVISGSDRSWRQKYTTLTNAYSIACSERNSVLDERKQISWMERSTHNRNVFYRGLTTLTVGLTIMAVYALAHWLEIPMPLMRLPI
jgi:hypothetical protein